MVMKKLMFALALVSLVFTSAQAQKQLGGEHNVEVNLTPFGETPIDGTTFKYRNFLDDDKALRVSLILSTASDTYTYLNAGEAPQIDPNGGEDFDNPQMHMYTNTTRFGIMAGYEMHFGGTDNLSPYFGFEGFYVLDSRKDDMEFWSPGGTDVSIVGFPDQWSEWTLTNQQSISSYGLNLMLGADYYFNDAIYIGFETGLRVGVSQVSPHVISSSNDVAYQIMFNDAEGDALQNELDSYTGLMEFDVINGVIFDNGESVTNANTTYLGENGTRPSHLSGFELRNAFNTAIRFGFLFD